MTQRILYLPTGEYIKQLDGKYTEEIDGKEITRYRFNVFLSRICNSKDMYMNWKEYNNITGIIIREHFKLVKVSPT